MHNTPDTSDSDALAALRAALVIPVFVRSVYGTEHIYVSDEEQRKLLSRLTGKPTLTQDHYAALMALGFTFELVPDPRAKSTLGAELFKLGASFHTQS